MRMTATGLLCSLVLLQAFFPAFAEPVDPVEIVKAATYRSDQLRSTMIATAERFKVVVNENESARRNLDEVAKAAPNDKAAYKTALRRSLDADDAIEPFESGLQRAAELKDTGYAISAPIDVTVCNGGACSPVSPEVLIFMVIGQALSSESQKGRPFGPNNELVKFFNRPLGGPGSELVKARDWAMDRLGIGGDNNDLGRAINDPGKEFKRGDVGKTLCNWFGC